MGDNLPPLESITEEEAVLLAEYGVSGPYDDLLRFPAPSTCVFGYGGRDVFLTGTTPGDDADSSKNKSNKNTAENTSNVDHTWPLECLLLRHTNLLSSSTAMPLLDDVTEVLNNALKTTPFISPSDVVMSEEDPNILPPPPPLPPPPSLTRPASIATTAGRKENGNGVVVEEEKCFSISPSLDVHDGNEDMDLLLTMSSLLQEADKVLERRVHYMDPMSEEYILEKQQAAEKEERCWTPIHFDEHKSSKTGGDGEGESAIMSTLSESETHSEDEDDMKVKPTEKEKIMKKLFAYEFGPTVEEQLTLCGWDEAVLRSQKVLEMSFNNVVVNDTVDNAGDAVVEVVTVAKPPPSSSSHLPPVEKQHHPHPHQNNNNNNNEKEAETLIPQWSWAEQHRDILESIATMEVRDSELQAAASLQLAAGREELHRRRPAPPGQIVFDDFVKSVNKILPPAEVEVQVEAAGVLELKDEEEGGEREMSVATDGKRMGAMTMKRTNDNSGTLSVAQIQKKARREGFRVRCETREAWLMQEEERRATHELQCREEKARAIQDDIQKCISEESRMYSNILTQERMTFQDLSRLERQHILSVKQSEHRRLEGIVSQLVHKTLSEHWTIRSEIMGLEEDSMAKLMEEEEHARDLLRRRQEENEKNPLICIQLGNVTIWRRICRVSDKERKITEQDALQRTVEAWKRLELSGQVSGRKRRIDTTFAFSNDNNGNSNTMRLQSLLREANERKKWLHEFEQVINNTLTALQKSIDGIDKTMKQQHHRVVSNTLLEFSAAASGVTSSSPPPYSSSFSNTCSSLHMDESFSASDSTGVLLDAKLAKELQTIIFGGVRKSVREVAQLCHTLSFVLEQITSIDFSSLATLEVCIATKCVGDKREKCMTAITPFVQKLDLGGNSLHTLPLDDLLRVFPSLQSLKLSDNGLKSLTCRAVSMRGVSEAHAHSLAQATRLSRLDISMNELQSIEAVGKLLSYQLCSLVLYANHVHSLLPLASCTRLEFLEASRNKISSLTELQHLPLLQTVDVSENQLTTWDALAQSVLMQNLYLSRNQIHILPKSLSLTFLRQLFMNKNRLEVLPSECFRWLPLLSVIHVENNSLRDISGLANCPRLTTVGLSFNKLQHVEDLSPLRACKRLQVLSVNENPFTSENNMEGVGCGMSTKVRRALLLWFPQLSELNNEKVNDSDEQKDAMRDEASWYRSFSVTRCLRRQYHLSAIYNCLHWPCGSTVKDVQQACSSIECHLQYMNSKDAYEAMFVALASDLALMNIQKEQDILSTLRRRRYHDALHVEKELQQRMCESKQHLNPVLHRLSDEVEERNQRDTKITLRKHLALLQSMPEIKANMHVRPVLYHERVKAHKEAKAKSIICEWMRLRILGRRAKKELEALKLSHAESQRQRYETAARVIQPVWRGAALRSRLKRILHPSGEQDDDDDDEFAHVSIDFMDDAQTGDDSGGVGAVLQRVLQSHGALPNFPVQASSARIVNAKDNVLNSHNLLHRSSSAMQDGTVRVVGSDRQRPESQPQSGVPRVPLGGGEQSFSRLGKGTEDPRRPQPPPSSSSLSSRVDDEWGPLVSSQLRKRQKKMERAQRENMRHEFMKDPLKVRRAHGNS